MWFLEHETLFGGKRIWLRPGSQQLFGRTKSGEQDSAEGKSWKIDNKAVSRKHVMLKVHEVTPEDGTQLHAKPKIDITDLSCRQGTTVDAGKPLKSTKAADGTLDYARVTLTGTEHEIRLAQGYPAFKLVWRPVVFTYASRESKDSKAISSQLHALGIKTTSEFLYDKTTHVVSQKRNLPKVLSGLVAGKHVVTSDFLDSVLKASRSSLDQAGNYEPAKLEEDFDAWWPKEKDFIPPIGAEPTARPQEMLEPDSSRAEVFSGLTFVFLDEGQYNSLLDPIATGGGKGLFYEIRPGETTVQEYVDYVHSVAGKKRGSRRGDAKLNVVTVRLVSYPDGMDEWAASFVAGVDQTLGQRSILQNEFLDAIITKDRVSLQRPPAETITAPSTQSHLPVKSATPENIELAKAMTRKRIHRPRTGGRFTGFDDYEPPPKRAKVDDTPTEDVPDSMQLSSSSVVLAERRAAAPATQRQHSPVRETIEKEEQLDSLFPAAAKVRRQRAATRAASATAEPEAGGPVQKPIGKGKEALLKLQRAQAKAEDHEMNIREQTRLHVKAEDERRKADEEGRREALDGIDIAEMRDLVQIEEMELRSLDDRTATRQSQANSNRWKPEWNGRKNFKKFRRRGAEHGVQPHKVMVMLEEAPPKKGFGAGNTFFLEDVEPSSTFRSRDSRHQAAMEDSSEAEQGFTRRKRSETREVVDVEDSEPEEEDDVPVMRTQRSSGRTQRIVETPVDEDTTQTHGKKRGATPASNQPANTRKRPKHLPAHPHSYLHLDPRNQFNHDPSARRAIFISSTCTSILLWHIPPSPLHPHNRVLLLQPSRTYAFYLFLSKYELDEKKATLWSMTVSPTQR
ncbi:hypothetical protein GQ44DRAFT_802793 [Phaeosphaeriaceae sp. PMI808]|nr:hypothetical protein GQ44DRAFT_802793 [Phaeosphaeriaceae sp. PMI808]